VRYAISRLKMEAANHSGILVNIYQAVRRHIPEHSNLHTPRVFENRALRGVFGSKRDEVIGGWRKLHNEELHNLYCSPRITRVIKSSRIR
jgi:hypothetical protein